MNARSIVVGSTARLVAALAVATCLLIWTATGAHALERRSSETVVIPAGQVVDDDVLATGRMIRIDGVVRGDVFAFGQHLTVTGTIDGDLIALAQQVVVEGTVHGNVRAAGNVLQLNGAIGRNVLGAAQLVQLGTGGRVAGNWIGAGETLSLDGDVGGTLAAAGQDVVLGGRVGRNAEIALDSLAIGPNARVGGNLTYFADHEVTIPPQAVRGQVRFQQVDSAARQRAAPPPARILNIVGNVLSVAWLLGSAIAGLIVLRLFPRLVAGFRRVLETQPFPSLGVGVVTLLATLPVALAAALTVIGLPLSVLLLAGYVLGVIVGWLLLAAATGTILLNLVGRGHTAYPSWTFLLGLLVLYLATRLPILGGLFAFLGVSLGMGALLITAYHLWRGGRQAAVPAPAALDASEPLAAPYAARPLQ